MVAAGYIVVYFNTHALLTLRYRFTERPKFVADMYNCLREYILLCNEYTSISLS